MSDGEHSFRVMLHQEISDLKEEIADLKNKQKTLEGLCLLYRQEALRMQASQQKAKMKLQAWRDSK